MTAPFKITGYLTGNASGSGWQVDLDVTPAAIAAPPVGAMEALDWIIRLVEDTSLSVQQWHMLRDRIVTLRAALRPPLDDADVDRLVEKWGRTPVVNLPTLLRDFANALRKGKE